MCRPLAFLVALLSTAAVAEEVSVRDPMRPLRAAGGATSSVAAVAKPRFVLTAVLIASSRRVAVVNGTRYQLGATIDGAELVAIEAHGVRLREAGAELEVSLAQPSSRRPAVLQGGKVP